MFLLSVLSNFLLFNHFKILLQNQVNRDLIPTSSNIEPLIYEQQMLDLSELNLDEASVLSWQTITRKVETNLSIKQALQQQQEVAENEKWT